MIHAPQYGIYAGRTRGEIRMCGSKDRHESEGDALAAVVRHGTSMPLRAYECRVCGGWHLTKRINGGRDEKSAC